VRPFNSNVRTFIAFCCSHGGAKVEIVTTGLDGLATNPGMITPLEQMPNADFEFHICLLRSLV
jgi:hypothetical protein